MKGKIILSIAMSEEYEQYVFSLAKKLESIYETARNAREKGFDPFLHPEPRIAKDLAELVEGMVGPEGVAESIRNLSGKLPREELAFKIAEEIVYGKFGHMDVQGGADQAIRTALAILTEGITAAPLQGVAQVAVKLNSDRTKYLAIYYAGPIRSAGGTEQALSLLVGDFVRRLLGLDRYKPTEDEIERFVEEMRVFERSVGRFQYHVSDEELRRALQHLPVEVTGLESNPVEVAAHRDLPRIETNRVRGGALRVVNDGVVGRSAKVWTIVEKLGIEGWGWLKGIREIEQKRNAGFMEDIIAGRPVFSFPSRRGGFRLRYGRSRNTGLAAVGVHPATMMVLQGFLAAGTQLRIECPGKAGVVLPVDTIEPPIVRLRDGSVVRVSLENFEQIKDVIDKVLFLGDILIGFGDFLYTNKPLFPSGLTEEWWCQELHGAIKQRFNGNMGAVAAATKITVKRLEGFLTAPFRDKPTAKEALSLASLVGGPLHPSFTFYWSNLSPDELRVLRKWFLNSQREVEDETIRKISGRMNKSVKQLLEKACIPHKIVESNIELVGDEACIIAFCLGLNNSKTRITASKTVLDNIGTLCGIHVGEKAPTYVGARMGRPEKARRREMKPMVHVLFPVGLVGGHRRNIVKASNKVKIEVELVKRRCSDCRTETHTTKCPECGGETILDQSCLQCGKTIGEGLCPICKIPTRSYSKQSIDLRKMMNDASERLNLPIPELVKGVKGLMNETKTVETLEKGILRSRYNLSVFKDGTIRFDATNAPLTHFKPKEIGVPFEKLQQLGYLHDCHGNTLSDPDQICELKAQDVIIPLKSAEYFVRVANFLDDLLEKAYGLPPFYSVERIDDLVGHLIIGLAPHTSVGILGRVIGFTGHNVCYAHVLWHSAKRRDCDGDEDALMLALDTILNFSKAYLPAQIGGIMDAPLFIIPVVNPLEVQRQAHEVDVAATYPLAFYEKAQQRVMPRKIGELVDLIEYRLNSEAQFQGFNYTIPVSNISMGNCESVYKRLGQMLDKLSRQLTLAEKINAVDAETVARKVLTTHFMRDIMGNLRAFTTQSFRCKKCSKRLRRLPLRGKCPTCGGDLVLTVHRGGIEKYLEAARQLVKKYRLPDYYTQRLALVEEEIRSLFEGNKPRQVSLSNFVA
ncbi:MAG: DNA polymerase II large subunit [Candidatus Bathyarchaeota archaeon]|nr:MAG: DNA polymerase II large subunit [Candidatus Bathyarchaeota archaeon]